MFLVGPFQQLHQTHQLKFSLSSITLFKLFFTGRRLKRTLKISLYRHAIYLNRGSKYPQTFCVVQPSYDRPIIVLVLISGEKNANLVVIAQSSTKKKFEFISIEKDNDAFSSTY